MRKSLSISDCYQNACKRLPHLVLAALLAFLCCAAVALFSFTVIFILDSLAMFVVGLLTVVTSAEQIAGWAVIIMAIALVLIPYLLTSLFFGRIFAFMVPAIVIERMSVLEAVARSQQLAKCVPFKTTLLVFAMLPLFTLALQLMLVYGSEYFLQIFQFTPILEFLAYTGVAALDDGSSVTVFLDGVH